MSTGPVPHVGGPIAIGCPNVLIGGMPAARVGDMVTCCGPPDTIVKGSMTVMIGGMPAARLGDTTAHGGTIVMGFPQVMIGDMGPPPGISGLSLALPTMALPTMKKFSLSGLVGSFTQGLFDGIFNKGTMLALASRFAVVALGANPQFMAAVGVAYGMYSLYKTLDKLGDGNVIRGLGVLGDTLTSGDPNTYAYLAGSLASIAVVGKMQKGIGPAGKASEAMSGVKSAKAISQVDDALADTATAAGKAAESSSSLAKVGKGLTYANRTAGAGTYAQSQQENEPCLT